MKAVYLKNFRKGFATNSSSTHSIIYRNKDDMFKDLNIFELNYYDRFDSTIAASKEAKIKYIAANIMWNNKLFEIMSKFYPDMNQYVELIKEAKQKEKYETFGMCARGPLYFSNNTNLEASIDYLRNVIEDDDIIIVGGSDEMDFVYDTKEGHEELAEPDDVGMEDRYPKSVIKNGNYWIGYGWNGKLRFKTEKGECVPEYPELVDLRITNKCQHGCPFCFMDSNMKAKEADLKSLERIISCLSSGYRCHYDRRVEFSVGGGNVLLYPHLEELFKYMKNKGHIINTTINAKDCETLLSDKKFYNIFTDYVSGIGVSVNDEKDIEILGRFKNTFTGDNYKQIVIHLIPELLGVDKTLKFVEELKKYNYYDFLFLGYKTNGRGGSQEYTTFTDEELTKLFNDSYCVSIDTTFANTYAEWLKNNYETEHTITMHEGEYSMYIDGVEEIAYKSSYQLDKPYSLKIGKYKEHGTSWFNPIEAFSNIRRDNGFKVYDEENTESA